MQKTFDDHLEGNALYTPDNSQGLIVQRTTIIDANSEHEIEQGMQEEG